MCLYNPSDVDDQSLLSRGEHHEVEVTFSLPYAVASAGDTLYWTAEGVDGASKEERYKMSLDAARGHWSIRLWMDEARLCDLRYRYKVYRDDALLRIEPPVGHQLSLVLSDSATISRLCIEDRWVESSPWHRRLSAPLANVLAKEQLSISLSPGRYLAFHAPYDYEGEVCVVGASTHLGAWHPDEGIMMQWARHAYVCIAPFAEESEYKFVLRDAATSAVLWEEGDNRHASTVESGYDVLLTFVETPAFASLQEPEWKTLEGTVVPLFSLRTAHSYGIGDFGDAADFVAWLAKVRHRVFQMLPFYDTTFTCTAKDSYPYSAITTYGLHPLYLDVRQLPYYYLDLAKKAQWERRAQELNASSKVCYEKVLALKTEVMDACFEEWWSDERYEEEDFCTFWTTEADELLPYCLFCTLRDRGCLDLPSFESVMSEWVESRSILGVNAQYEVLKHAFRQYYLHRQLMTLRQQADKYGVLLKGDLPIGVSMNSVDVWQNPDLFHLDMQAGAPPDAFSTEGQNWGFPTYDWERIAEDGFAWWRRRLQSMSRYLHALRIDHILGFFRIWSIPLTSGHPVDGYYVPALGYPLEDIQGVEPFFVRDESDSYHPLLSPEAREGYDELEPELKKKLSQLRDEYYYKRNEFLWSQTALTRLSQILSSVDMLICAEDLGLLPQSVKEVLSSLELLSLEVLRMPKVFGHRFVHPEDIPALSVLTTSTHDTSSLRAWWMTLTDDEKVEIAQLYGMAEGTPMALIQALRQLHPTMLILPLSDWCVLSGYGADVPPTDEQINHPERQNHIWDYRMPGYIASLPSSL